ncbi:receptor-type tyrosine-protein phosphatase epsilon-like [Xenia sp. Carnegie-2017]|uniref:receptor-type tyrosine-protein phosphatase epsilon-like n=1 Tax=Xenia sp. Carnegie-2017 TaxID=2897299 RepID=UPI001F04B419|nr:receptor-type tyrosine-protein phosphatase epsilon-like [Xenia sp. Carnegie-2017]
MVNWTKPSVSNGVIREYKYCRNGLSGCDTTTGDITRATITGLSPGTEYNITVQAFTIVGGQINSKVVNTTKSGFEAEDNMVFETIGVSDSKTQIGFKLPELNSDEVDLIKSLHVFVKRWLSDDSERTFQSSSSRTFGDSNDGMIAYVALEMNRYVNGENIIVGNMSSSARRKRRNTVTYLNAPLVEDTEYGIFVRVFYDDQQSISQNSDVLRRTTGKDDDDMNTAVIVIVVIICILVLVIAIVGLLLLKRRKSRTIYRDIVLEPVAPVKPIVRYPIPIDEFRQHCSMLDQNAGLEYQEEYENIRNGALSAEIGKRPENIDKNRYNNIHAYDDSRVILSEIDGEEGSDYINANHIDGYERKNQFIAAQGTLKNTIVDFWRMIWEQNVSSIVMLANPIEKGREKLAIYWPQDKAVKHGPFLIKLDGEVELADYVIRKMTITKDNVKEMRQMTQFHYTVWPDHGVPQYTTSLQAFLTRVRKFTRNDENPLVVHCSAGVGRTGTFIGIFAMLDMIEKTKTVDIFNYVCQMRKQRTHMVQVESQYVFLHKAVLEAIECGDTEINAPDLRVKLIQLSRTDPNNPDQTLMEKQFKVLQQYTFVKSNTEEAKKSFNADKNRNKAILPYEDTRVSLLKSPGVDGSDYINASFIDSYQVRGMYIATQFPLENTVNEFWRMVWEKKCNCIVMLANIDENPTSYEKYWTDKTNDALLCGNLLVSIENEENADEFVIRNFKLKKNDGGETRDVWHFHFLSWNENEVPRSPVGLIQMIGRIQDVQRQCGNNPIVVHCSDGGGRTGAFCALVTSLERVKQDQSFNLFQTIMLERIQRPRMVSSIEQYQFCFQAILQFLQSFDEYANFKEIQNSS